MAKMKKQRNFKPKQIENSISQPVNKLKSKFSPNHILWILLISFAGAALYFQTYNYQYTADDGIYTYFNNATQEGLNRTGDLFKYGSMNFLNIDPVNSGSYRPLTLFTFALEKQLVGDFNPSVGHVINIILYFFMLIVLGFILIKLFHFKDIPVFIPLLILLLYAVHPLHVEVVASVKSRDTLLSALFSFSAVLLWLNHANKRSLWIYISIGLLFFLALLSKEESITFIAVVFLIAYFFLRENFLKSFKHIFPFLFAGVIYLIIRQIVLDPPSATYNNILNNVIFGAQGEERLATNLYIYLYYIKLLIFPHPLSWDYSFNQIPIKSMDNLWVIFSLIFFIGLIIYALTDLKKRKVISFAILFYISTFSIFSNFTESILIGSTIGERFMFIPSLGFCIIPVYVLYLLIEKLRIRNRLLPFLLPIVILTFAYTIKSYSRIPVWKDNLALNNSGIKDAPNSWRTHVILADELRIQGVKLSTDTLALSIKKDTAQVLFEKAVLHFNKGYSIIGNNAKQLTFLNALGECYLHLKDTTAAKDAFIKSVANPKLFFGLFKLGVISFNEKNYEAAIDYYTKALKADSPDFISTYKNLGATYLMNKEYKNAIDAYNRALEYGSSDDITTNLSFLYAKEGNIEKANSFRSDENKISVAELDFIKSMSLGFAEYDKKNYTLAKVHFIKCYSDFEKFGGTSKYPEYLNSFAHSLLQSNDIQKAKTIFNRVANENPKNYFALKNLGFISFQYDKNYDKAIQFYTQSLQANSPDYFQSYSNLGTIYLVQNRPDEAIENYELALRHGTSPTIISNLFLLWKSKGDQEKMKYYQEMIKK